MPPIPSKRPLVTVYEGDCRDVIHDLHDGGALYDMVFADPPFNIGHDYNGFDDWVSETQYGDFTCQWLHQCRSVLRTNGVMCLHGPDAVVELYLEQMKDEGFERIAWLNWHYRFGQCNRSNWIDARCHCLVYRREGEKHTWNPEDVLVDSDRVRYKDKRVAETERGGRRLPGTVWGVPSDGEYWGRVQGNSEERRPNHPNQLPEVYLERLIRAYTNVGSIILDPFGGSGTTATVAQALGRRCDTIEVSRASCESIEERVAKGAVRVKL